MVSVNINENNHYRGLHIVLVNPINFQVDFAKCFDTYKSPEDLDSFIEEMQNDNFDKIVIAAC